MLVLSRYRNESIIIGTDIEVVILEIRDQKVRLGIDAPASVSVHRREVFEAIKRNQPVDKLLSISPDRYSDGAPYTLEIRDSPDSSWATREISDHPKHLEGLGKYSKKEWRILNNKTDVVAYGYSR
jgi:carbon storage regulator